MVSIEHLTGENTCFFFVVLYLLITIPASIIEAHRSRTSKDYVLAGRNLGFTVALATAFVTWFGPDSAMGAGSTFAEVGGHEWDDRSVWGRG